MKCFKMKPKAKNRFKIETYSQWKAVSSTKNLLLAVIGQSTENMWYYK